MTEVAVETPTAEEVQRHFDAAMDSVNLLNAGKPEGMDDMEWAACVKRNVEHLKIMVAKDFWQGQDISVLSAAIASHE